MDVFLKYYCEQNRKEDLKSTFQLSAKFTKPEPKEAQKQKYFEDEFKTIVQKFYSYLSKNKTLLGDSDKDVQNNLKNKIDSSDLILQFDTWLDQYAGQFTIQQKPKPSQPTQSLHSSYSNPQNSSNSNPKYVANPPPSRQVEPKIAQGPPFDIQKNPPPTPQPIKPSTTQHIQTYPHHPQNQQQYSQPQPQPQSQPQPQPQHIHLQQKVYHQPIHQQQAHHQSNNYHQPSHAVQAHTQIQHPQPAPAVRQGATMQYQPPAKLQQKQKQPKARFIDKLAEYLQNPQRMNIIKAQLNSLSRKP